MFYKFTNWVRNRKEGLTPAKAVFLVFSIAFVLIIYFPFYFGLFTHRFTKQIIAMWDILDKYFNIFGPVPMVIGLMSVVIIARYNSIPLKILFVLFYTMSVFISGIALMGATSWGEVALYFSPHLIILFLYGVLLKVLYYDRITETPLEEQEKAKSVDSDKESTP